MKTTTLGSAMILLVGLLASAVSGACGIVPFNETWSPSGTVEWIQSGNDCVLRAATTAPGPAAATVHYRRAERSAPFRISFVLTLPPALNAIAETQSATLTSGAALAVPAMGPPQASLYTVRLSGDATGTIPQLTFEAACASPQGQNGLCSGVLPFAFADLPLRITLELDMGVGDLEVGELRAWLGNDTSGSPALTLAQLDNARWGGIDRVSLGLSNVSAPLAAAIGTQPFSFSEITLNEQHLFWSDFESDLAGNIVVTGAPITSPATISGNTCAGQLQFPNIASGTTRFLGPTVVHALTLGPSATATLLIVPGASPVKAFACPAGSGPSGPCVSVAGPLQNLDLAGLPAGQYQIVIGRTDASCGSYQLTLFGQLN